MLKYSVIKDLLHIGDFHGSERDWDISQYHFQSAYELGDLYDNNIYFIKTRTIQNTIKRTNSTAMPMNTFLMVAKLLMIFSTSTMFLPTGFVNNHEAIFSGKFTWCTFNMAYEIFESNFLVNGFTHVRRLQHAVI
jgi:hypothetical protein